MNKTVKRGILGVLAVVLVVVLAFVIIMVKTFSGQKPADENVLTDGTRPILDGYVATFAIPTPDPAKVILIDCGNDKDAAKVKAGVAGKTVSAIFLTHGHPDHVAGCAQFPGVPVFAGKDELPMLTGNEAAHGPLPRLFGKKDTGVVAQPLEDGADVVVEGVHVHAFATPGHTRGSTVYVVNKTAFFGDAASVGSDGKMIGPAWIFSDDVALGLASLAALPQKMAAAHVDGVESYACAHSGPMKADPAQLTGIAK